MLITRRSDYAMRICRVLHDGKVHNVREICQAEEIPKAFAYKILRELEMAGLVKSERGNQGGYYLNRPLSELTLYDVVNITVISNKTTVGYFDMNSKVTVEK